MLEIDPLSLLLLRYKRIREAKDLSTKSSSDKIAIFGSSASVVYNSNYNNNNNNDIKGHEEDNDNNDNNNNENKIKKDKKKKKKKDKKE